MRYRFVANCENCGWSYRFVATHDGELLGAHHHGYDRPNCEFVGNLTKQEIKETEEPRKEVKHERKRR